MFVSLKNSNVEALICNMMVFGTGLFRKELGLDQVMKMEAP